MNKSDKLLERFKSKPSDFTWTELTALLRQLGFREVQGRGSRVKFFNEELNCLIQLHKPHPAKILKRYAIMEVITVLTKVELL